MNQAERELSLATRERLGRWLAQSYGRRCNAPRKAAGELVVVLEDPFPPPMRGTRLHEGRGANAELALTAALTFAEAARPRGT